MTSDGGRNNSTRQLRPRCHRCQRCCCPEHCPRSESDRVASPNMSRYTLRKKPIVRLYFHSKADMCTNIVAPTKHDGRREPRSTTRMDLRGNQERRVTRAQKRELEVIQEWEIQYTLSRRIMQFTNRTWRRYCKVGNISGVGFIVFSSFYCRCQRSENLCGSLSASEVPSRRATKMGLIDHMELILVN